MDVVDLGLSFLVCVGCCCPFFRSLLLWQFLFSILPGMNRSTGRLKVNGPIGVTVLTIFSLVSTLTVTCWLYWVSVPPPSRCSLIVVSLTTFGMRTFGIGNTLHSLLSQTVVPDVIVVNLSLQSETASEQQVRSFLDRRFGTCVPSSVVHNGIQCDDRLLVVIGEDYGPATKVLGALSLPFLDGDACILSVDDDTVYDPQMVETLTSRAPDTGALGFSCEEVPWALRLVRGSFAPDTVWWRVVSGEFGWMYPFQEVTECKGWLHGYRGVVYRRKFFDADVFDMAKSMPGGCFYADDVRLAGYLWSKGIRRYVYPHFLNGGFWGRSPSYHMETNASKALGPVLNAVRDHKWACVRYFNEFR
jgi:hypothetical protein